MFTKYSGADFLYAYMSKKGFYGEEVREKEIEKEIFELENEFDMVWIYVLVKLFTKEKPPSMDLAWLLVLVNK